MALGVNYLEKYQNVYVFLYYVPIYPPILFTARARAGTHAHTHVFIPLLRL